MTGADIYDAITSNPADQYQALQPPPASGPGGMNLHNLTYEHAGHYPASVLLFNGRPVF